MAVECNDCMCAGVCPWLRSSRDLNHYARKNNTGNDVISAGGGQDEQDLMGSDNRKKSQHKAQLSDYDDTVRTYRRRWLMLGLFSVFSLSNAYMWIHLNIIANVVLRYYNASLPVDSLQKETAVDWLSLIYMLAYLIFIPLGMYILDSYGLRVNNVTGCILNALGAWLKCGAVSPSRFPLVMAAQTMCGIAQIFVVSLPPRLAAVWFGHNEVSTATAIGVFGNQLGVAVGFLVPPHIVPNSDSLDQVGDDLNVMFYAGAAICTLLAILMLLILVISRETIEASVYVYVRDLVFIFFICKSWRFRERSAATGRPPHPPSRAQLLMERRRLHGNEKYHSSILRLIKNPSFVLMMLSYGLNTGAYYAISTLLNYMVLYHFPGEEVNVGNIGLTIILTGIGGSICAGLWLDRTKFFKSTSLGIYLLSTVGMLAFTFTLDQGRIWIVFLTAGALGFFMTGYLPVGYEFAAEITYPEPEGTSSGLLTASAMLFGIVMTLGMRAMMNQISILAANISVSSILLLGSAMTAMVKSDYNRQEAEKEIFRSIDNLDVEVEETSPAVAPTDALHPTA